MKEKLSILLAILFLLLACNLQEKKAFPDDKEVSLLPPLDSGMVYCQFDTLFHLTGEKIADDSLIRHASFFIPSLTPIGNDNFISLKDSSIVRTIITEDSVIVKKVYDLDMRPYWGMLVVNASKNRMAFAYEHYPVILVMDLEAKTVKTIDFNNGIHHYKHIKGECMDCVNPNIIYYRDAYAGEDYFYVLYWGHSHPELLNHAGKGWRWVRKEKRYVKTSDYQQNLPNIVEQYDWNGNPINRYLLEGDPVWKWWGKRNFVVDEEKRQFSIFASKCYSTLMNDLMCDRSLMVYSFCLGD